MAEGYNAGNIVVNVRADTRDLTAKLNETQKKLLENASITKSVFGGIVSTLGTSFKKMFTMFRQHSEGMRRPVSEINTEISRLDNSINGYKSKISAAEKQLANFNARILNLTSSRSRLNAETRRSVNALKKESRALNEQIGKYKQLFTELTALRKKKAQERYESYIRQSNSDISLSGLTSNREATKGAILLSAVQAMKYWKDAFGSLAGYGQEQIKHVIVGMAGYLEGSKIFSKFTSAEISAMLNKAKTLIALSSRNFNTRSFRAPIVRDNSHEIRSNKLKQYYEQFALDTANQERRSNMGSTEQQVDKVKQNLQKILSEYNLTYEAIELREHESMLRRNEITEAEFLRIEGLYQLTQERIGLIQEQNEIIRTSFIELAVTSVRQLVDGFSVTFVTAVKNGQNVLKAFGNFFKSLLSKLIEKLMIMIVKLIIIKTLMAAFGGGGGLLGKVFGFSKGGGVSSSGKVYKAAGGMYVSSGTHSTADDVPALLSRGESVLNARVTHLLGGEPAIKSLNRMGASSISDSNISSSPVSKITNVNIAGSVIDTAGLISVLDEAAANSGSNSLYNTGSLV